MELIITGMILQALLLSNKPMMAEAVKPVEVPETLTVERVSGTDRYETAINVNHFLEYKGKKVVLASGENFPDALSAGAYANHINAAFLLTKKRASRIPFRQNLAGLSRIILRLSEERSRLQTSAANIFKKAKSFTERIVMKQL